MEFALQAELEANGEKKDLLRLVTCGSAGDGKSTVMGRLLHDKNFTFDDQLAEPHKEVGSEDIDFASLLNRLEGEQEQGTTIDVTYRCFSTARRSFILADTPGHEQFTRNMAIGASSAQLAIILIDARRGIVTQTRRHSLLCSLHGIRHVVVAVNKIDLVNFDKDAFDRIVAEFKSSTAELGFSSIVAIPVSARYGDNVARLSDRTAWYRGPTLLDYLEEVDVRSKSLEAPFRFPIQSIDRPDQGFPGFNGMVVSGRIRRDDTIVVAGSGQSSRIKDIVTYDGSRDAAESGDSVTLTLSVELDIADGDVLTDPAARPEVSEQFAAYVIWMDQEPLFHGRSYLVRVGTKTVPASVTSIKYKINVNTWEHLAAQTLELNDIGFCNISTATPVAFDPFGENPKTGSFIIIDRLTNRTVGAGLIAFGLRRGTNIHRQALLVGKPERSALKHQRPAIIWFTGLPAAGKSTIANAVEQQLNMSGHHTTMLDGDNVRHGLNRDLGFTEADRVENIRRIGEVAKLMVESGLIVLCSFISPYRTEREMVRRLVADDEFIEVFVDTSIEDCIQRDPKGLYAKAKAGALKNFTGIDAPYEIPVAPEIHLQTRDQSPDELASRVVRTLRERQIVEVPPR